MCAAPAGYESASDDEEGFVFGEEIEKKPRPTSNEIQKRVVGGKNMIPKGGFGMPTNYKASNREGDELGVTNSSPYTVDEFKDAVMRGTLDQVKSIVDAGMPVDIVLRCGWTTLMYAANMAFSDKLSYLIDAGANVNYHKDQYTVLMTACACNKNKTEEIYACVDKLIDKGANVNTYDRYHTSPLMNASREGHDLVVSRLIGAGADVNKQNNRGWTALSWAVSKGQTKVVKILLEANADKNKVHTDGQKAVDVAKYLGHDEISKLLGYTDDGTDDATDMPTVPVDSVDDSACSLLPDKSFQTYGELELFLSGLSLNALIPVFRRHKVTFEMILQMTDKDLVDMKINELGNRKRILDGVHAVHKKEWETTSLPQLQYNKALQYEEVLAMVANISKHLRYIASTMSYMNSQSRLHPAILEQSTDGLGPTKLDEKSTETLANLETLETEVRLLQKTCQKLLKRGHFESPDAIERPIATKRFSRRSCVKLAGVTVIVGGLFYWRGEVTGALLEWSGALQRWLSVDL